MKQSILVALLALCSMQLAGQVTVIDSFLHGGVIREYRLYVPASYNAANPVPLVFNLHGYTSNNQQQEAYGDFRPVADTANFLVVHPNGTLDGSGFRFWNAFGAAPVDDMGFLLSLLDTLKQHYSVNSNRIYTCGMSNGGFMSHLIACSQGQFAAIASVTGSMTTAMNANCAPSHPTPVMQIHGTADAVVPYLGGGQYMPVESLVNYWASFNGCNPVPAVTNLPDINLMDGCTATHYLYSAGTNGATVEFYKINGGGHSWPGAPINVNITNMDFNASREIWRFFSQYSLNNLATAIPAEIHDQKLNFYPNPASDLLYIEGIANSPVEIYNLLGQSLLQAGGSCIDVSRLSPGIYVLRCGSVMKKIVIE